ncbi:MBL fold metallo-hydrolase [Streptomyces sp. NPDC046805]|uniref:MBL fold metallo-hydrolase n=1 Tax=Streptomyces sp. NPDC046805 TaxID=3155134 RepID=UPI0033F69AF1
MKGGRLPQRLTAEGLSPDDIDIDTAVYTHLHLDHIGGPAMSRRCPTPPRRRRRAAPPSPGHGI